MADSNEHLRAGDADRWGRIPLWWLHALRLKRNALAVAVSLSCHADDDGRAWPDSETIAQETGVRRDRVFEAIKELKAAGIIVKSERRYRKPTYHWLRYKVPDNGTPDNGTTDRVEYRKPGDWSTDFRVSKVPEARSEIRSSIRSMTRSESIGPQKLKIGGGDDLQSERARALIACIKSEMRYDDAKAKTETEVLVRQAGGDLDLAYACLKDAAHRPGVRNVMAYAMRSASKGVHPKNIADTEGL